MKEFNIGLSAWIIQDGNYEDFLVNESRQFAVEFYSENIEVSRDNKVFINHIVDSNYRVNGNVLFIDSDFLVLDVGLLIYWQYNNREFTFRTGQYVTGDVYLGIDPFFYFESGYRNAGIPELIYTWKITDIKIETAPFVEETDDLGRKVNVREKSKICRKSISKTDAWNDDNGNGDYILVTELKDESPKRIFG